MSYIEPDSARTYLINGFVAGKTQNLSIGTRWKVLIWLSFDHFTS